MIGCDTLPIYISAARPAKHEDEVTIKSSDRFDLTFAFGK